MDLAAVMEEIAEQLDTIDGLRVYAYPPDSVSVPAAVVDLPDSYTYDETYRRGMDRMTLPVGVLVSKNVDRSSVAQVAAYFDGDGDRSIKTVIEARTGQWTSCDTVRVMADEDPFQVWIYGGVAYLAGVFSLDIAGTGAS